MNCIRCNKPLEEESVSLTATYKENLFKQFKDQNYTNEWNNYDNKH